MWLWIHRDGAIVGLGGQWPPLSVFKKKYYYICVCVCVCTNFSNIKLHFAPVKQYF